MKYLLLIPCLVLCSCSSKDEEPAPLCSTKPRGESNPLILECPLEDLAEYHGDTLPDGWCLGFCGVLIDGPIKLPELSFGAQGGVRCITRDVEFRLDHGASIYKDCIKEFEERESKKIKCPCFTLTKVDGRVLHISVNQNETGAERKLHIVMAEEYYVDMRRNFCPIYTFATQSAE